MLVWPLHLPSCCSSVGEAKNTLLSKNPFSIRGGAVVTTEMAPHSQSPETTSHYCDCRELPENLLLQVRPWLQPGSPPRPTQLPQLPDRGWWPSSRVYQPACLAEKGGDSLFLQQTSTDTTAFCSKVFQKASFEHQVIHILSCLWTINPDGWDSCYELIPFSVLLSNTVILQSQEHCRHTAFLTMQTGSQQIQQAMVLLRMQSWACFEPFTVQEENVTGMFLKDLSYFSTRDWKLQFCCSTDMWTAGKMLRERMVQCKNEDIYKRRYQTKREKTPKTCIEDLQKKSSQINRFSAQPCIKLDVSTTSKRY